MSSKQTAVTDRIRHIEESIAIAHEYLKTGKHAHWHGFRPHFVDKVRDGKPLPPHKDWVKNVFLPHYERRLREAEMKLERLTKDDRNAKHNNQAGPNPRVARLGSRELQSLHGLKMKRARPSVNAIVTFLPTGDGGRQTPPDLNSGIYRPHIVIQSPDVRVAIVDDDGVCREPYQGVVFTGGPDEYRLGASAQVSLELCYFPDVQYDDVVLGATFTIREGHRVVAYGQIESRSEPPPVGDAQ